MMPVVAGSIPRGDTSGATDNPNPTSTVSVDEMVDASEGNTRFEL
jgi:hypothetical protein